METTYKIKTVYDKNGYLFPVKWLKPNESYFIRRPDKYSVTKSTCVTVVNKYGCAKLYLNDKEQLTYIFDYSKNTTKGSSVSTTSPIHFLFHRESTYILLF